VIFEGECFPEKAVWEAPGSKRPAVFRLHLYVRPAYVIREWNETGMPQMPRNGAIILSDLIGKLDVLSVTCEKGRLDVRYILAGLIRKRGRDAKLIDWLEKPSMVS
jgi:hypothetical protein